MSSKLLEKLALSGCRRLEAAAEPPLTPRARPQAMPGVFKAFKERSLTMRTFAEKPKRKQPTTSAKSSAVSRAHVGQHHDPNSILNLQRTMGNQALLRLLESNGEERNTVLTSTVSLQFG